MISASRTFLLVILLLLIGNSLHLHAQNPAFEARRTQYIDSALAHPNRNAVGIQAYEGVQVDTVVLQNIINGIPTDHTLDFRIVQLVRVLFLSNGAYDSLLLPALNSVPYWINHGDIVRNYWSENHMIMWSSSDWLLHEKYGRDIHPSVKPRLLHYLNLKIQHGFYEFNSSTYAPYTLSGLLNLADFASDPQIKSLATQAAERLLKEEILMLANDQGVFFPTAGRNYYSKYDNPYGHNHNSLIWLLTGLGEVPMDASHSGGFLATSTLPVTNIMNSWQPNLDTTLYLGHSLDSGLVLNATMTPVDKTVFQWSSGAYFHPDLALETGSLIEDSAMWDHVDFTDLQIIRSLFAVNDFPNVAENLSMMSQSSGLYQAELAIYKRGGLTLSSAQNFWPGKVGYQQYPWVANLGTTAVFTASGKADADWYQRNDNNGNFHLPYVEQKHHIALMMYWPEKTPPLLNYEDKEVALHFRDTDFDQVVEDSLWIMGRQADRYVGVRRTCLDQINGERACDFPDGQAWVCIVGDSVQYGGFANFQQVINQSVFQQNWFFDTLGQQYNYQASILIDSIFIDHTWARDSTVGVGLDEPIWEEPHVQVYPNPTKDQVTLDLSPLGQTAYAVKVVSVTGETIWSTQGATINDPKLQLNTANWQPGMYFIKVSTPNHQSVQKLLLLK